MGGLSGQALWDARFFERAFKIPEKEGLDRKPGKVVSFRTFKTTERLLEAINRHRRVVGLKPRQAKWSSLVLAKGMGTVMTLPNQQWMIMAQDDPTTTMLLGRADKLYESVPGTKPRKKEDSVHSKSFPDLNSSIEILTAAANVPLRGRTLTGLHLSEASRWTAAAFANVVGGHEALTMGAYEIWESNGNRFGDHYHTFYKRTKEANEQGDFTRVAVFGAWHEVEEYAIPAGWAGLPKADQGRLEHDEAEDLMVAKWGLGDDQLRFRRFKIRAYTQTGAAEIEGLEPVDLFDREYPMDDVTAFVLAGDSPFSKRVMREWLMAAREPIEGAHGPVRVWKPPVLDQRYVIFADPTGTSPKGDYAAAHVMGVHTLEQCAVFHRRDGPDEFAVALAELGKRYNMAWIVVEANTYGDIVIRRLLEMGYPDVYVHTEVDNLTGKTKQEYGVSVTAYNKHQMVAVLAGYIKNRQLVIHDKDTIEELLSITRRKLRTGDVFEAALGHDDLASALWVGMWAYRDILMMNPRPLYGRTAVRPYVGAEYYGG